MERGREIERHGWRNEKMAEGKEGGREGMRQGGGKQGNVE